ncbi:MAG TPA: M1 family metallopeptidase, partial [Myxococcota bacterium]|nr:M1 family metallopeptidase [Myxococcota bacterium]
MACVRGLERDARTSGSSSPFAEPNARPRYAPSRRFRILHADVALHLDPVERVYHGVTTFRVEPQAAFDGVLRFDLDGVEVLGVEDASGAPLPFDLGDASIMIRSDAREVTLRYRGGAPAAGLYFVGPDADEPLREPCAWTQCQDEDAHFFMPCHDHPRVRHPWSVLLRAPAGFTLLSNGRRVDEGEDDRGAWARFEQADPMPVYLFTAVAARLEGFEDEVDGVRLRCLVPPGGLDGGRRAMGRTGDMVRHLAARTGVAFPWPRYDQVVVPDFSFGGMENTACTTMTDALLIDERTGPHWPAEGLVVHELAHQWFGDLVTCTDWSQAWLNESFATFCETDWWEATRDEPEAVAYAWQQLSDYLDEDRGRYRRPIAELSYREPIDVFDRHLYEKGSLVLRTLRSTIGADAFWAGVHLYLTRHAHGSVHTLDLRRAMEEVTGLELGGFFDTWINRGGHPVLDVKLGEEAGLVTIAVSQRQEGAPDVYELPLRVEIVGDDGVIAALDLPVRERERAWAVPVGAAVRAVRVDRGCRVLAVVLAVLRPYV